MNYWTELSAKFAQQRDYLDQLYKVYPICPNEKRMLTHEYEEEVTRAFDNGDNAKLVKVLLKNEIFPIKDSFVAYLRKDPSAIERNPQTVNRIAGNLRQIGTAEVLERCTEPKETNRQMGPLFKKWIDKGVIGAPIFDNFNDFLQCESNCILNMSDEEMKAFAKRYLGYRREKGIDFIGKFNHKYILGEAKFLTDTGGHQNAQFEDAISTMQADFSNKTVDNEVVPIAILDGVLYIASKKGNKMYKYLEQHGDQTIMSALVLREFLYQV